MKIAIGCDHGGIVLKPAVKETLVALGAEVVDFGTFTEESVDYPVYGLKVAEAGDESKKKHTPALLPVLGVRRGTLRRQRLPLHEGQHDRRRHRLPRAVGRAAANVRVFDTSGVLCV